MSHPPVTYLADVRLVEERMSILIRDTEYIYRHITKLNGIVLQLEQEIAKVKEDIQCLKNQPCKV